MRKDMKDIYKNKQETAGKESLKYNMPKENYDN